MAYVNGAVVVSRICQRDFRKSHCNMTTGVVDAIDAMSDSVYPQFTVFMYILYNC